MRAQSSRNKTIDFTLEEASPELLSQIIHPTDNLQTISNKIINGDSFKVMTQLAPHQVDLALIDPPYNLNKQYDGLNFKKMSTSQYQTYTQKWIDLLKPLLKENASIYAGYVAGKRCQSDLLCNASLCPERARPDPPDDLRGACDRKPFHHTSFRRSAVPGY